MSTNELVSLRREGRVGILVFDNGPLNVSSKALVRQLGMRLEEVERDETLGVLILTGAGQKAFVAGADISGFPELAARDREEIRDYLLEDHQVFQKLTDLSKPTIAVINGLALGGGLELALMCDIRIAEAHAKLGLPEINLGMFPGYGGTQRLPRLIGADRTKELIFSGRLLQAEEALEWGIVSHVVPKAEGMRAALSLSAEIAKKSAPILALAKRAVNEGRDLTVRDGVALEAELLSWAFLTRDNAEGVAAFLEKRAPAFLHQ